MTPIAQQTVAVSREGGGVGGLRLWLIYQDANSGYDTYDSAVVVAPDEDAARNTHPRGPEYVFGPARLRWQDSPKPQWFRPALASQCADDTWAPPENVGVRPLGVALPQSNPGVILASFNAG